MPDRPKPHEETWNLQGCMWGMWPPENPSDEYLAHNEARMKLAECAPDMARMLLAREFVSHDDWKIDVCAECEGSPKHGGHKSDCAWLALMKRAGIR